MTGPEIEKRQAELNFKYYGRNPFMPQYLKKPWTEEDKAEMKELSCRDMANSCLIYGSDPFRECDRWVVGKGYCKRSYMADYEEVLGTERVKELVKEQEATIAKATIHVGAYEDSEGCVYNTIDW